MRPTRSLLVFGLLLLTAPNARADRRDPVAAEALFRAGRLAADRGDYQSACPKFDESYRLDPAIGTMLNLAVCDEQIGKIASAWQLFREVAQRLPVGDDRIVIATSRASALEPKLPRLILQMPSAPLGATVLRDGTELGTASLGVPLPVDPGEHTIIVKWPAHAQRKYSTKVAVGETHEITLEPGPLVDEAPALSETVTPPVLGADRGDSRRTLGYVTLGVGGAGILTSLVFGGIALSAKTTVDAECEGKRCTSTGLDAADRGSMAATVSTIAFGVGIAGAALGAYFLLGSSDSSAAATLPLSVGVAPLKDGAFVTAVGRLP